MLNFPLVFSLCSFIAFWIAGELGLYVRSRRPVKGDARNDITVVRGAVLTLVGLMIGFTFSMAVSRYDLRQGNEAQEANTIGTEYSRVDLMPSVSDEVKEYLRQYTGLRIAFYQTRDSDKLHSINAETLQLQNTMWSAVSKQGILAPTPISSLVISGMNAVIDSQGYTQASWWDRIPVSAWCLLVVLAVAANTLVGYCIQAEKVRFGSLFILPLIVAVSFFLIADIDSPRGGIIKISPTNLLSVSQSIK